MHPINIGFIVFGIVFLLGGIGGIIKPNFIEFRKFPSNRFTQGPLLVIIGIIIIAISIMFQIPQ